MIHKRLILGSQSEQRRRLVESIAADCPVVIMPPTSEEEPGFQGLVTTDEIERQLQLIVQLKTDDVCKQLNCATKDPENTDDFRTSDTVICADTVVVCTDHNGEEVVLGKPPLGSWQDTVRQWFHDYYSGRVHEVWTGFQVSSATESDFQIVKAKVEFPNVSEAWISWYLATEEPLGKAGGYGIQGHAAAFVKSIQGSLTTIIGLPVWELRQTLVNRGCLDS
ncbi:MAG: Maf family protein [Fuerstiella sp.]